MSYTYSQQQQQPNVPFAEGPPTRTLWMGELDSWMDDNYLRQLWWNFGHEVSSRISIDKYGGCYAFIDFPTHEAAKMEMECLCYKGDLGADVDDTILLCTFQSRYKSAASAKVMIDPATGFSRGFGFVKFFDEVEQQRSLEEMQGVYVGSSPIRVSVARPKAKMEVGTPIVNVPEEITTAFVGGLNNTIAEDELRAYFGVYGNIVAVKIIPLKNIAFIQYEKRISAEQAIVDLNGSHLGGAKLRLSFGRTQLNMSSNVHYPSSTYHSQSSVANTSAYRIQTQPSIITPSIPTQSLTQPIVDLVDPNTPISIENENANYLAYQKDILEIWSC